MLELHKVVKMVLIPHKAYKDRSMHLNALQGPPVHRSNLPGDERDFVLAFLPPGTEIVGVHGGGVSATVVWVRQTEVDPLWEQGSPFLGSYSMTFWKRSREDSMRWTQLQIHFYSNAILSGPFSKMMERDLLWLTEL